MLKKGDRVMIRNETLGGEKVDEGYAKLVRLIEPETGLWEVEFEEERGVTYRRFVWE